MNTMFRRGFVPSLAFYLLFAATGLAQDQTTATATSLPLTPEAQRVLATYAEALEELKAVMSAGGKPTARSIELETRLADEVKHAEPELVLLVRTADYEAADAAAYALRFASNLQPAVSALLDGLARFNGSLANNVGLALEYLLKTHPALSLPVEPLVPALRAREWNAQQKVAQVIDVLLQRGAVTDPEGLLSAALIPMLASQRVQVFRPAREILARITGESLGNAPAPWMEWYAKRYGRSIDLAAGIYELAQIVQPAIEEGTEVYRVDGTVYTTRAALVARVKRDAGTTRGLGRKFGLVIQVPDNGFPQKRLYELTEAIMDAVAPTKQDRPETWNVSVVISPGSFEFGTFSRALSNLEQLVQRSRASPRE